MVGLPLLVRWLGGLVFSFGEDGRELVFFEAEEEETALAEILWGRGFFAPEVGARRVDTADAPDVFMLNTS